MSRYENDEALAVIASAVDENHDGLVSFTEKLKSIDDIPAFWWNDHPVWVSEHMAKGLDPWPMQHADNDRVSILSSSGARVFAFPSAMLRDFAQEVLEQALSDAEFALFADLATGLSIDDSARLAGLAVSTRRKQLQSCFRKLGVVSQAELISLGNRLIDRLSAMLTTHLGRDDHEWTSYVPFLPTGARCGVLEAPGHRAVRYLELGPVTGRPVIVLHPMMFPHIDVTMVDQFYELGWRTIWPVRSGCLSTGNLAAMDWAEHCARTVADIHAVQQMCAGVPTPIIALVSSGAYATSFAAKHPECAARIDYVSTCFSSGKGKSRDVYFGDFLLRNLRQNGRMAVVAIQHLAAVVFSRNQLETTMRRVFRGSAVDQALITDDFADPLRSERAKFAVRSSIDSMRYDYLSQLNFNWNTAKTTKVFKQFWHGAQDSVHDLGDLVKLSENVTGNPPNVIVEMGHLTQGPPLQAAFRKIAAEYLN